MVKFMILFQKPVDIATFETRYNELLALIERMPLVIRRQVINVVGSPMGETRLYRILEVYFDDTPLMEAALRSFAGQEAGKHLNSFPHGSFEMVFADIYEESGGQTGA
jgi:uncharacterized protein (TIGR02118 family)